MKEMLELQRGRHFAIGQSYLTVVFIHYMEHHIIVGEISIVVVLYPIGRTHMHLYVTRPLNLTDTYPCIEKIGACIGIELASAQHDNRLAIGGGQPAAKHLMLPDVV